MRQQVLVGRDERAVKEAADRYGWAEAATDWHAVLERDDIDIVDICTPGDTHAEIAMAALAAGKHVLVEKPLANTVAESERWWPPRPRPPSAACCAMVGFNYRRVPALALARELIADGRIGEVRQVRAAYLQDWLADDAAPMTWRLRKEAAGSGALGDLGSHVVDQVHYLLGERVTSRERSPAHVRHRAHRRRRARAGHRRRRRLGDARRRRPARSPASRSAGWRPAARTA